MLESVEAHARALSTFEIDPGHVSVACGDVRDLGAAGIEQATVDAVVTSPPYSIALDHVKNDERALEAMRVCSAVLRREMTGVRGRGPKEKLALYNEDMRRMFREVARVLKRKAVREIREHAAKTGAATLTSAEIDREIAASRLARRRARRG